MAENFYTILTATGKAKLANSAVLGSKVNFKTLKVGDGKGAYYEPSESQTSLVNEVWSGNVGSISVDENNSNWIVAETLIPATIGGFFIREAGIFDEDGDLIAISKLSETYKPVVSEGSIKDLCIKIVLEVSNVESVTLKIDPTVIVATRKDIDVLESKIATINSELYIPIYSDPITTNEEINDIDVEGNKQVIVDVEGKTIVNLLGSDGDCEDVNRWNAWNGTISLDGTNKVFGSNGFKFTIADSIGNIGKDLIGVLDTQKYYCISGYLKNGNVPDGIQLGIELSTGSKYSPLINDSTKPNRTWVKIKPKDLSSSTKIIIHPLLILAGSKDQYGYCDGLMIEEITDDQYNDSNFQPSPYVSGDMSVGEAPTRIKVRGKNLLNLAQGTFVSNSGSDNGKEISNTSCVSHKDGAISVKPNTYYTVSLSKPMHYALVEFDVNKKKTLIADWSDDVKITNLSFITRSDTRYLGIAFALDLVNNTTIYPDDYQIQLIEGSTQIGYEKYHETYLNLKKPLRSFTGGIKDTIYDGKLIKRVEKIVLDGSLSWQLDTGIIKSGMKHVYVRDGSIKAPDFQGSCIKYNNKILKTCVNLSEPSADTFLMYLNGINVGISNSESGWGDNYTPTSDEIKAYFMGWSMYIAGSNTDTVYNNSGIKAWVQTIKRGINGDASIVTYTCPTMMIAPGYTPYRLYYQLATPIVTELSFPNLVAFKNASLVIESDEQSWVRPKITYRVVNNQRGNIDEVTKKLNKTTLQLSDFQQQQMTYKQLAMLVYNKKLMPGTQYVLIDYRTKYIQPDTKSLKEMGVERLVLTATSECTFNSICSSIDYPKDIIHYRFDLNVCEDGVTPRTGFITRRIDESFDVQIDAPLDWRKMLWARWLPNQTQYLIGTTLTNYATWTSGAAQLNTIYKVGNALYMAYNTNTPTSSTDGNVFLCIYPDITVGMLLNADLKIGSNGTSDIILQKSSVYKEYLTFGAGCSRIRIDYSGYDNNEGTGIIHLHNNVFISDCDENTLGFSCHDNTFGVGFDGNVLGPYCYNNFFLGNCDCNVFEANCSNNRMIGNVWNMHLGAGCYNNIFNAYCRAMRFAGDCYNNIFGLQCYCNTFEKDCHDNYFGNLCAYNTCTSGFYANRISNECYTNFFGSGCRNNTLGYQSSNNHFSSDCRDNVFGNNFGNNALSTSTVQNIFGNNKYNMIIKYMRSKNISAITALENRDYTTTIEKRNDGYIVYWSLNSSNAPIYTAIP